MFSGGLKIFFSETTCLIELWVWRNVPTLYKVFVNKKSKMETVEYSVNLLFPASGLNIINYDIHIHSIVEHCLLKVFKLCSILLEAYTDRQEEEFF